MLLLLGRRARVGTRVSLAQPFGVSTVVPGSPTAPRGDAKLLTILRDSLGFESETLLEPTSPRLFDFAPDPSPIHLRRFGQLRILQLDLRSLFELWTWHDSTHEWPSHFPAPWTSLQ